MSEPCEEAAAKDATHQIVAAQANFAGERIEAEKKEAGDALKKAKSKTAEIVEKIGDAEETAAKLKQDRLDADEAKKQARILSAVRSL